MTLAEFEKCCMDEYVDYIRLDKDGTFIESITVYRTDEWTDEEREAQNLLQAYISKGAKVLWFYSDRVTGTPKVCIELPV